MAKIKWVGSKMTITLSDGSQLTYTIQKVKGCSTYSIYKDIVNKEQPLLTILKRGFLTNAEAKTYLLEYVNNWK